MSTSPLVGSSTPASILAKVVFPIPFEPNAVTISSWNISPASAVNLNPARVIRKMVDSRNAASLIVDHDIVFIDYISDRAMVFNGTPGSPNKTWILSDNASKVAKSCSMTKTLLPS